jgi:sigma-B regulation protein RsbU (phosphoserine phosphatase)
MSARLEDVLDENRWLREQLEAKAKVAAKALAAQQRRVLEMEAVNERLAAALRVLEEKDRRISEDLAQACAFQQRILPRLPPASEAAFTAVYRPAEVVGGDFYDVARTPAGAWRVFIADAIGHGVQAALRTMILKAEYDRVRGAASPAWALRELNDRVVALYPGLELQCTAACFDVHVEDRCVEYATCAHPPLVHVAGGVARQVYQPSPFLGVVGGVEIEAVRFDAQAGDRLFVFSDGLVEECRDDEEFGMERVMAALQRPGDLDAVVAQTLAELSVFVGTDRLSDDLTLVGLEIS